MNFEGDEDCGNDEDIIPGDNDKQEPALPTPLGVPNAPGNLTHILPQGGDIPVVLEPRKPS